MNKDTETETPQGPAQKLGLLTDQLLNHLETRWEYATLNFTEKMSEIVANLASLFAAAVFGLLLFLFLSVGFAIWLGDTIGSRAGGFALAGLIFIPFGFVSYVFIRPFVRDKIIQNVINDEDIQNES